jgi:F0F1-type ATP synthase alpha subunit
MAFINQTPILKKEVQQEENSNNITETYLKNLTFSAKSFGKVVKVKDGVAFVTNLQDVTFGELVLFIPSRNRLKQYREKHNKA